MLTGTYGPGDGALRGRDPAMWRSWQAAFLASGEAFCQPPGSIPLRPSPPGS